VLGLDGAAGRVSILLVLKAIFKDFYTALIFLFTFSIKEKSKSLHGLSAMLNV